MPAGHVHPPNPMAVRRLLWRTVLGLLGLTLLAAAAGWWFRDPIEALGTSFVDRWGLWGVALGFFIPDATALPIPHDLFLALGHLGGLPDHQLVLWASTGSILGGCVAFLGSRLLRRLPFVHARLASRAVEVDAMVARYGVRALAVGALTPLPYSLIAWACGVMGMPFRQFLAVSMLRIVRVGLYLGLIRLGLVTLSAP